MDPREEVNQMRLSHGESLHRLIYFMYIYIYIYILERPLIEMFTDNNEHAGPDTVQIPCSWEMKISSSKSWIVLSPKNMKFSCSTVLSLPTTLFRYAHPLLWHYSSALQTLLRARFLHSLTCSIPRSNFQGNRCANQVPQILSMSADQGAPCIASVTWLSVLNR